MFCPKCGANQVEGRKFCTTCGTSLNVVSQPVGGQVPTAAYPPYPSYPLYPIDPEREQQAAKGLRLTITGGIFVAIYLFSFILALPMRGEVNGWIGLLGFIGLIMGATGAAKLVGARPPYATSMRQMPMPAPPAPSPPVQPPAALPNFQPQPIFSAPHGAENAPPTGALSATPQPVSVLEEATQHLPEHAPPREVPK